MLKKNHRFSGPDGGDGHLSEHGHLLEGIHYFIICLFEKRDVLCYRIWHPSICLSVNFLVSS